MVSKETLSRVAEIVACQVDAIQKSEIQKEVLCMHKQFNVLNAFCRIAGHEDPQHIDSIELVTFFRDNGLVVSEADCYMLICMFDSNSDGLLSLADLTNILAPASYTYERHKIGT
jgi:hypothetical protein